MSKKRKSVQFLISVIAILTMTFSGLNLSVVQAQNGDGLKRELNAQSGRISFIGPETGRALSATQTLGTFLPPQDSGMALAKRFAPEFGIENPEHDLTEIKKNESNDGYVTVRYQQKYQDIPVIGGELIIHTNINGDLYSMNGEISQNLSLLTQPKVASEQAQATALQALAKWYQKTPTDFVASAPELWIYDESLLRPSTQPAELVWRIEVTAKDNQLPIRELVLVNAQRGYVSLHFNQIDAEWETYKYARPMMDQSSEKIASALDKISSYAPELTNNLNMALLFAPLVSTYTAGNTSSLPGSFLCNQTDPNCALGDFHARAAHQYAIGTYNLYAAQFNRDSIDNSGMTLVSTVHYCDSEDPFFGCPYANAFWSGTQMVYGDAYGFALADDVVAHELTHGVTQYESNLFYYYQSGAINESFSDVFGEYYDQVGNATAGDTAGVKWLVGEDISDLGAIRSMIDPPAFDNPDKMSSPLYYKDDADNGGVHYNSGLNNKAVFLMVDGGTFNGKTVTALGWDKVAALYYEVNTNLLTSGADYSDLYFALQQACTNLLGQHGITSDDCTQVKNAADAVEMNGQPEPNFNTDAPLCDSGGSVNTVFYDNLESGISNWTFNNGAYTRWQYDSPYGTYARSGLHSLYADGQPGVATDATARLAPIVIPANGYLHFAHAYGFNSLGSGYDFDGGVLEYSINNGSSWVDAGSLIDYNGYGGTIFTDFGNPLMGRSGFVGASHGYISTRLNLSFLAGQSVTFRWRMGLGDFDFFGSSFGWWVDDVRVYNCASYITISGNAGVGGASLSYVDGSLKTVTAGGSGNYSITVPVGWSGIVTPYKTGYTFTPANRTYANLQSDKMGQNYTAQTCVGCADVNVQIGGAPMGNYTLAAGESIIPFYDGVAGGPVQVTSTNDENILTSEHRNYQTSFSETLGYPDDQLTTKYWFTRYAYNANVKTWILVANPSGSTANVSVYIGNLDTPIESFNLAAGASVSKFYNGVANGPVLVESTNGVNILASEHRNYQTSFSETLGYPDNQLTTKYWFTRYAYNANVKTWLLVTNPSGSTANVSIYIGNLTTPIESFNLGAGASVSKFYNGVAGGPVVVESTNGVNILASEHRNYQTSFSETLGYPANQLTTEYWFTRYAYNANVKTWVLIANPSGSTAEVSVYVGSSPTPIASYSIAAGQAVTPFYDGVANGPVRVVSTNGVDILASEHRNYQTSFSETLGYPEDQLTTKYWFTRYAYNANVKTWVLIANPQ